MLCHADANKSETDPSDLFYFNFFLFGLHRKK